MRRLLVIAFVLLWPAPGAAQYFCGTREETAEAGVRVSEVVFLGRAEEILREEASEEDGPRLRMFERRVRFTVLETFKGPKSDSLLVGNGWEGFIVRFEEGEVYLVYAYRRKAANYLAVDACTRTRPLALAAPDLEYLRRPQAAPPTTRLTGAVAREVEDGDDVYRPYAGVKVTAVGTNVRRETATDASGAYRFVDLPPGTYEVLFDVPAGAGSAPVAERVSLAPGEWRGPDYVLSSEARLVGFVVGPDGRPLDGASVAAVPLEEAREGDFDTPDEVATGSDGRFELENLDPGDYVVVANPRDTLTPDSPFRRTLFPAGRALDGARLVTIEAGRETRLPVFRIARLAEQSVLHLAVVDREGKPVPKAPVTLDQEDRELVDAEGVETIDDWTGHEVTDEHGRLAVTLVTGLKYEITVRSSQPDEPALAEPVTVKIRPKETRLRVVVGRAP